MTSKLDQMRDQFRERLNLRPVGQTETHVIKVETNDNNNNNIETKLPKSDYSYSSKYSIPTPRKIETQNDIQKSFDYHSDVNANKFDKSNKFSVSPESGNSLNIDSNNCRKKVDLNQDLAKRLHQTFDNNKELKADTYPKKKFSDDFADYLKASDEGMACRYCQRRFALTERLEKHESVCMSSLDKSRVKFNSFEQRVKGQHNDYLLIYENASKNGPKEVPKNSNWRQKHEYCVAAIKSAKGQVSSGPSASQILASIQPQCDYCKRRFNEDAIKRHLPICAKLHHKKLMKI